MLLTLHLTLWGERDIQNLIGFGCKLVSLRNPSDGKLQM